MRVKSKGIILEYDGHAFHKNFQNGRVSGKILISDNGFNFKFSEGDISIPLNQAVITLGGANDRLVFITHQNNSEITFYTSDRTIVDNSVLLTIVNLRKQIEIINKKKVFNFSITTFAILAVILVIAIPFIFSNQITKFAVSKIPASLEKEIGELGFSQYILQKEVIKDKQANDSLNQLFSNLELNIKSDRYKFKLFIIKDSSINAFALPGGYMIVNTGLINKTTSPEELMGVLSHETIHVTEQHGLRNVISSAGIVITAQILIGDIGGLTGVIANAGPLFLIQHYSRKFEKEADVKGLELLEKSLVDPSGIVKFFKKIKMEEEKILSQSDQDEETIKKIQSAFSILSSHPATDKRIEMLNSMIDNARKVNYKNFNEQYNLLKAQITGL